LSRTSSQGLGLVRAKVHESTGNILSKVLQARSASPFDEPTRHFRFSDEGITNEIDNGRRTRK